MKGRYKNYLKLNLISIFFIGVSFISISLAWFAYTGLVQTQTQIDVKAWNIQFNKNGETVSNDIIISLDDLQPGMDSSNDNITINNKGDSDAKISYKIQSARILYDNIDISEEFGSIEDKLANDYPFSINVSLDKKYLDPKESAMLNIAVNWPLDSDTDEEDSIWGNQAYSYNSENPTSPSIKIVINIKAEQNTDEYKYNSGDLVLYDVVNNTKCSNIGGSCIRTHVLNLNSTDEDNLILLPDLYEKYDSGSYDEYDVLLPNDWDSSIRELYLKDILNFISQDINNSYLIRENLSNRVIGYINYNNRFDTYINKLVNPYNSYFKYNEEKYDFLSSNQCYWLNTEHDSSRAYALVKDADKGSIITPYDKSNICSVVPVVIVPINKLIENS